MITSTENKQVKNIVQLNTKAKVRKKQGVFVVEGIKMFLEAPKDRVESVYVSESFVQETSHVEMLRGYAYEVVADAVFAKMCDTLTPQGIITVVRFPEYTLDDIMHKQSNPHIIILESIQDPGNLGTIIRTGEGAGISGVIVNKETVDLYNPKTLRGTMGSIYRVPVVVAEDLTQTVLNLQEQGVEVYAAHLKGTKQMYDMDFAKSCAFLIGNEGNGLTDELAGRADSYLRIPMEGQVESLNAGVAASLLMYETLRQRGRK